MSSLTHTTKVSLVALLLCCSGLVVPALAQTSSNTASLREGLPGRRVGGGVRQATTEDCLDNQQSQIALTPENNLLLAAKAKPTFLFYLPTSSTERTVEFVLANEKNEEIYVTTTQTNSRSGIVRLDLSESPQSADLAVNQNYRWYLSVVCNVSDRSNDLVAEGWIRRDASIANQSLAMAAPTLAQATQLRNAGLWSDALASLDTLRRLQPEDPAILATWDTFLKALDLRELVSQIPVEQTFEESSSIVGLSE